MVIIHIKNQQNKISSKTLVGMKINVVVQAIMGVKKKGKDKRKKQREAQHCSSEEEL